MFGPLFVLKYKGKLCPCLESAPERAARNSLELLSNLPVLWLRDQDQGNSLVGKLFSNKNSKKGGIPSTFCWVDGDYGPVLQVQPQSITESTSDDDDSPLQQQSAGYIKTLSLNEIKTVEFSKNNKTITLSTIVGGKPKKLLVFQVVEHDELTPTDVQQALQFLMDWEVQRIPEEDREVSDTTDMNRAQKAAHFCQRELELKRMKVGTRKTKRKVPNMSRKNGGGMKYTAIAMANRDTCHHDIV